MRKLIPVILILFWFSANSQITIYQQDLPQPGDTFMLYVDKTPSVSLGNASASAQNWDYSSLGNDSTKYAPYGITANLPFASSFPNSNSYTYGPAVLYGGPGAPSPGAGFGYTMWSITPTGMWVEGYRSNYDGQGEKNIVPNPKEMLMPVPCTYGHNQYYDSKWEVNIAYVPANYDTLYRSRTHKNIQCDAWGSMTTPLGVFNDVIRIHEFSVTTDSIFVIFGGVTYYSTIFKKDTINKYLFWSPEQRHPVAIAYCTNAGLLQRIEYVSWANVSVPIVEKNNSMSVYPNPATENITILLPDEFKNQTSVIRIFDLSGKLVLLEKLSGNFISLPINTLNEGIYYVENETGNGKIFRSEFTVK